MCKLMREIWLRGTYENMLSNLSEGAHKEVLNRRGTPEIGMGEKGPPGVHM